MDEPKLVNLRIWLGFSLKYGIKALGVWLTHNLPLDPLSGGSQLGSQLSSIDNTVGDQHSIIDCPTTINIHLETESIAVCLYTT